ncbi:TolC family protein [Prosthecochloris sp. ZM_2]|uniref:TolC family protein n=1 Tax=Prosthecochloris sp. ZM_2 TaxID=2045206 RepID=UPI000DF81586|nr:TolC family protein [Prosthecochloris sp. ZM_2]RNA64698.1 TolC family protein [Prosthecochloris sp. ZM_2]
MQSNRQQDNGRKDGHQRLEPVSRTTSRHIVPAILAIIVMAAPLLAAAAGKPRPEPLTLDECIHIALEQATDIRRAEYNRELRGAEVLKNYGQFLPSISVNASYTPVSISRSYSTVSPPTVLKTSTETLSLGVTTSLNLFNGFRNYADLQGSLQRKDASELTLARAQETIVYDVTQAYYQVLLNRELLRIARENLSASEALLQLTRRQYEIGLKPVTDFYQQEAETANSELAAIKAENTLRQSRIALQKRLQSDPREEVRIEQVPPEQFRELDTPVAADNLVQTALDRRRDLQGASLETGAAKWDITSAASSRWPSLDLSFTYGSNAYPQNSLPPVDEQLSDLTSYSLVLSMNWNLFDGFLTGYGIEQAKTAYLNRMLDEDDLRRTIVLDLRLAAGDYNAAREQITAAENTLRAAEKAFETVERKYELGAATFVEVNAVRASLVTARSEKAQALYNLALQKNILDFLTGSRPIPTTLTYREEHE